MAEVEGRPAFFIGLTMAGAISAGAYTAGVIDFLVQALEAWETSDDPRKPGHRVVVPVVSGASAGAITGALAVAALAGGLKPRQWTTPDGQQRACALWPLYETWVKRPRMMAEDGGPDLLSLEDLAPAADGARPPVRSALNAALLDQIAERALPETAASPPFLPRYFAEPTHVYLAVSNLRGVPYAVAFREGGGEAEGAVAGYDMLSHGDMVHYAVSGVGSAPWSSPWSDDGSAIALSASALFSGPAARQRGRDYTTAALASGAFPGGLAPRLLSAEAASYASRRWPMDGGEAHLKPSWKAPPQPFEFLNVDGGLINNEPFEVCRFALRAEGAERNPREGAAADRAVVMVDPFPEGPPFADPYQPDDSLRAVALGLFGVLKNQVRFKPGELLQAMREEVFSRFLIAPRRLAPGSEAPEPYPIACGALGGFGGFLEESFRDHDFQLGRRNCQKFLRDVFTLPAENPVVRDGWSEAARNDPRWGRDGFFPIVPLLDEAAEPAPAPVWPKMDPAQLDALQERVAKRADAVVPRLIEEQFQNRFLRWLAKAAWSSVGRSYVADAVRWTVQADLIERDLLGAPWRFEEPLTRRAMAALANPKWDLRAARGVARELKADEAQIRDIYRNEVKRGLVVEHRPGLWRLAARKPGWTSYVPLLNQALPLAIDRG